MAISMTVRMHHSKYNETIMIEMGRYIGFSVHNTISCLLWFPEIGFLIVFRDLPFGFSQDKKIALSVRLGLLHFNQAIS